MRGALLLPHRVYSSSRALRPPSPTSPRSKPLLSNLPAPGSAAYTPLYDTAERPHREMLEMTKAEVWTIATERWDAVVAAATRAGVKLTKLDATWNRALAPMVKSLR